MTKVDFKKTVSSYKAKHNVFEIITLPKMQYLMIDGQGDPNTSAAFTAAIKALYPIAFKLKFVSKQQLEKDYVVPPLEGLWWAESMDNFTANLDKSSWCWTLMLMTPVWITQEMLTQAKEKLAPKQIKELEQVRLEELNEGLCVQTLHIGSFDSEGPVLKKLHEEFIPANGLSMQQKHHEIYFSDFRVVAPEKMRTILRQPVERIVITRHSI